MRINLNLIRRLFGNCQTIITKVPEDNYEYLDEFTIDAYNMMYQVNPNKNWKIYKITEINKSEDITSFKIDTSIFRIVYRILFIGY